MSEYYKEVDYATYCPTCKHEKEDQACDECNDCLNEPARIGTRKPLKWEEK